MHTTFTRKDFTHASTFFLASEAQKLGLSVQKIDPSSKKSLLQIEINGTHYTIIGQRSPFLTFSAYHACKNKELTKKLLQKNDISTPCGALFCADSHDKACAYAKKLTKPIVIKPSDGLHGDDVFLNISHTKDIEKIIKKLFDHDKSVLIEEQFTGTEYRILASRTQLLSAIKRVPANIIGDGENTIESLIAHKNDDPRRGDYSHALIAIEIDDELIEYIAKDGYSLASIPPKGTVVYLRATSNLSTGGDSIDVTDTVHENLHTLAPRIIQSIPGLPFGGIDFMIDDITSDPYCNPYAVIEINSSPMISMHHEPYEGTGRNVARVIIKDMIDDAHKN